MEPAFGVEFLDGLAHVPQDLLQLIGGEVGIGSDQVKQGACEVGIDHDAVLGAEIDGHAETAGARKLVGQASGQIEDGLGFLLENHRLVSASGMVVRNITAVRDEGVESAWDVRGFEDGRFASRVFVKDLALDILATRCANYRRYHSGAGMVTRAGQLTDGLAKMFEHC